MRIPQVTLNNIISFRSKHTCILCDLFHPHNAIRHGRCCTVQYICSDRFARRPVLLAGLANWPSSKSAWPIYWQSFCLFGLVYYLTSISAHLLICHSGLLEFLSSKPAGRYVCRLAGLLDGVSSKPASFRFTRQKSRLYRPGRFTRRPVC